MMGSRFGSGSHDRAGSVARGAVLRHRWASVAVLSLLSMLSLSCATPLLSTTIASAGRFESSGTAVTETGSKSGGPVTCATPAGTAPFGTASPADVDLDPGALTEAVSYATARGAQSVRVYRHGCLVARSGNDPITEDMRLEGWSMTKGVVSTVVGRAAEMGLLSIDDPISKYLEGTHGFDLDASHGELTLRGFLNQDTGLAMAWVNDLWAAGSTDSAADELARPFRHSPGTKFQYAQTAVTVLVAVVEAATGGDFQTFARRELFEPIGITDSQWRWQRDGSGRTQGFAFLQMSPLAWVRLGNLILRKGMWGDQRLIDSDYIANGAEGTDANAGYGFLWWTNQGAWHINSGFPSYERSDEPNWPGLPRDAFGYSGLFDQNMIVIPSLDMVILRMGFPSEAFGDPIGESPGIRPKFAWRYHRLLMKALTDVAVPDPGPWKYVYEDTPVDADNIIDPSLAPFNIEFPISIEVPGSVGEMFVMAGLAGAGS